MTFVTNRTHSKCLLLALALCSLAMVASPAQAGEDENADTLASHVSLSAGVDFTTEYLFRGIFQEDQGFIAQPWVELGVNLLEGGEGDWLNSIDVAIGWWNSLQSEDNGGPNNPWYESDVYVTLSATIFEKWTVGAGYTYYDSPRNSFPGVQEVSVSLAYDDAACWENAGISANGFEGLQPYVLVAFETENAADGSGEGTYLEVGISPSVKPFTGSLEEVTLSLPVTLGLSLDDYYQNAVGTDNTFGFLEIALMTSFPLGENVELTAGPAFVFLDETTADLNDSDDHYFEIIGRLGITYSF